MYVFLGGSPSSGKSLLASEFIGNDAWVKGLKVVHSDIDSFKVEFAKDPSLLPWVNVFLSSDEKKYWETSSFEHHTKNLIGQSEALWGGILKKINEIKSQHEHAIFEGENLLPHLVKSLDFGGFFLVLDDENELLRRLQSKYRWGLTDELKRLEAKYYIKYDVKFIQHEARKYNFKVVNKTIDGYKILEELFFKGR